MTKTTMPQLTLKIVTFIVCVCLTGACKKYPEDGKWSKHTVKNRLEHKWELKECLVNDVDSIDNLYRLIQENSCDLKIDTLTYSLRGMVLEFKHIKTKVGGDKEESDNASGTIHSILSTSSANKCIIPYSITGYKLTNKKNEIQFNNELFAFTYDLSASYRALFNLNNASWDIRKLTDKDLIIETTNTIHQKIRITCNRL